MPGDRDSHCHQAGAEPEACNTEKRIMTIDFCEPPLLGAGIPRPHTLQLDEERRLFEGGPDIYDPPV